MVQIRDNYRFIVSFLIPFISLIILSSACSVPESDARNKIHQLMINYENQNLFNGVILAASKGEIIYNHAFGIADRTWDIPVTIETKFKIGSLSKPFTALLILQLIDEGRVSLDRTIADYLPEYKGKNKDRITIHHLLSHTSGMINSLQPEIEGEKERLHHSLNDLIKYCEEADLSFEPGAGFQYSNFGYSMLALIAERVTQVPFNQLLKERIFDKAGMKHSKQDMDSKIEKYLATGYEYDLVQGYVNTTFFDNSYATGAGGITSTPNDLYRWYKALEGNKLISEKLKYKMFTATDQGPYGYGWFVRKKSFLTSGITHKILEHSGSINGFGTYMAIIPEDSIVVIVLKNSRSHNYIRPAYSSAIGGQIISLLYGEEVPLEKKSIAMHLALLIGRHGIDMAVEEYHFIKKNNQSKYNMDESELNKLGIELYFKYNLAKEALKIFEVNMQEFPKSYNTYDSYAFILKETGDYKGAVTYYKKGLEILKRYPELNKGPSIEKDAHNAKEYIIQMEKNGVKRKS